MQGSFKVLSWGKDLYALTFKISPRKLPSPIPNLTDVEEPAHVSIIMMIGYS